MASDAMGWPDPNRPGVPENPEMEAMHLVRFPWAKHDMAARWHQAVNACEGDRDWIWRIGSEYFSASAMAYEKAAYLGPVYTRADLTAARQEAAAAGAMEMREAAAKWHEHRALLMEHEAGQQDGFGKHTASLNREYATSLRSLPVPASPALEAALERARAEVWEEAARIAEDTGSYIAAEDIRTRARAGGGKA